MVANKSNWVTVPEETLHTPVSKESAKPKKQTEEPVRHKFFWGVSFVVVIVAVTALLAPQQFANILQGNLFETSDLSAPVIDQGIEPLEILPAKTVEEKATETATAAPTPKTPESQPVVEPETEAVSIQVEPVVTAEPVQVEPVMTEEKPITEIPAQEPTQETQQVTDANQLLLQQLTEQLQTLQSRENGNGQAIEQLTQIVADQLRGSAPETTSTAQPVVQPSGVSPAISTTSLIATPQGTSTGYRPNTHVVSIHPQTVLAQNKAQPQITEGALTGTTQPTPYYSQQYAAQLGRVQGTPESGPEDFLYLALILPLLAILGWKSAKVLA